MTNTININQLKTADYNPRDITERNYNELKKNIATYGILQPLIVNSNGGRKNVIIGGHQRYRVATELGINEVPIKYVNLNLKKERALNLSLNKNTGHWNKDILANQFDIEVLLDIGFTEFELGINNFTEPTFKTFSAKLTDNEYEQTQEVFGKIMAANDYNETQSFMYMIQYFWKGVSVRANNNNHLFKDENKSN
jgi:hypothetical protein|tara:strand:+ start:954 stop:1538 length:585 start_codon:yes stop_codon:yes gene_type:complete